MANARGFVSSEEKVGNGWKRAYAGLYKVRPVGLGVQPFRSIKQLAETFHKKAAEGGISIPPGHHALCVEGILTVEDEAGLSAVSLKEDVSFAGDVWSLRVEFPTCMCRRQVNRFEDSFPFSMPCSMRYLDLFSLLSLFPSLPP